MSPPARRRGGEEGLLSRKISTYTTCRHSQREAAAHSNQNCPPPPPTPSADSGFSSAHPRAGPQRNTHDTHNLRFATFTSSLPRARTSEPYILYYYRIRFFNPRVCFLLGRSPSQRFSTTRASRDNIFGFRRKHQSCTTRSIGQRRRTQDLVADTP